MIQFFENIYNSFITNCQNFIEGIISWFHQNLVAGVGGSIILGVFLLFMLFSILDD